ncbi:MAG: PP2C family protein-serine/threonine phosphatase [Bryobacteraceae bacterium]
METGGPVIGLFRPATYEEGQVELEPGDLLVLFTDGISEAMNDRDEEWGEDSLAQSALSLRSRPVQEIMESLIAGADTFANGAPQHDDMTVVVLRVT